jgi:6-phosphogluconate dehydrogenase
MQLGMIGLGRMGANIARRLAEGGRECVVFDRNPEVVAALAREGATGAASLADLAARLIRPRAAWVMVPAGEITGRTVSNLAGHLEPGDVIIDGGNTYYRDDIARATTLAESGIHYVDVGTSGEVWGRDRGYCLMIGGEDEVVSRLRPVFETIAPGVGAASRMPGREDEPGPVRARLSALRPGRRRAFRQDGP